MNISNKTAYIYMSNTVIANCQYFFLISDFEATSDRLNWLWAEVD